MKEKKPSVTEQVARAHKLFGRLLLFCLPSKNKKPRWKLESFLNVLQKFQDNSDLRNFFTNFGDHEEEQLLRKICYVKIARGAGLEQAFGKELALRMLRFWGLPSAVTWKMAREIVQSPDLKYRIEDISKDIPWMKHITDIKYLPFDHNNKPFITKDNFSSIIKCFKEIHDPAVMMRKINSSQMNTIENFALKIAERIGGELVEENQHVTSQNIKKIVEILALVMSTGMIDDVIHKKKVGDECKFIEYLEHFYDLARTRTITLHIGFEGNKALVLIG